ncbi:MAG: hypothetical protein LVO36_00245 [Nitrosopumilus sp. (ex Thoosa mismalolli)]|nr:hypothetical protein [Nitrosopumilus sp. (ex Thoosa mismalolli)]
MGLVLEKTRIKMETECHKNTNQGQNNSQIPTGCSEFSENLFFLKAFFLGILKKAFNRCAEKSLSEVSDKA